MKKNYKRIWSVFAVLAAAAAGCFILRQNSAQTVYTKNIFAMNTYFTLKAYGPNAEDALREAAAEVRRLEGLFSVTAESSDIWRIDHAGGSQADQDTLSVIETALQLGEETDGALDITIYPVLREWGFTAEEYRVPETERLRELLGKVDYRQIKIDREASAVLVPEGVELDLGSLAKGYAGDSLTRIIRENGVTSAILDLGGNIQTFGRKPDGSLWQVAVKNPFDPGEELGVLRTADKAVVTSGSYERYFIGTDGKRYWHILDPADGCPADNGLVSVTVVGESGVRCDGLSTALFVMGQERAVDFWREYQDFEMILVTEEKELYITEGLKDYFQGRNGWKAEIITAKK